MINSGNIMYLVLIETSGNQAFIFSTNKLRENVGASESTYRACSQWVLDAVQTITGKKLWNDDSDVIRTNLLNSELNPPIETNAHHLVEVIIAASGKAMLLTRDLSHAKQVIATVTLRALKEAPGLAICGAIEEFDWQDNQKLPAISRRLHKKFEVVRSLCPSPDLRFLRLPIVEDCRTSGLPASRLRTEPDQRLMAQSTVSLAKRRFASVALRYRLPQLLKTKNKRFARSIRELNELFQESWLAVVHADGNGLGQIFINLEEHIEGDKNDNRNYIQQFRSFSLALDVCTRQAFIQALDVFPDEQPNPIPLVPLVLGGDDLTVVCDAKYALAFTEAFLTAFEQETQKSEVIRSIAGKAFSIQPGQLSACAGVAIVKPHFPFSTAYQLAEELAKSAKVVKDYVKKNTQTVPCSAIDFHVLYDTRGTQLEAIRAKQTPDDTTHLYNRPYIVSNVEQVMERAGEQKNLKEWLDSHHWSELNRRVKALLKKDNEGRRCLPNSQMHNLREGLFMGRSGADGQYTLIRKRYDEKGVTQVAAIDNSESLFWQDAITEHYVTGLLDAMDVADFWESSCQPTNHENCEESES
jgi:hypothetical protein